MATPVVLNVTIDARGAAAGAVVFNSAMQSVVTASQNAARQSAAAFSSVFSGTFLGGLARQAVQSLVLELKQVSVSMVEVATKTEALHRAVLSEAQANHLSTIEVEKQADAIHRLTFTYEDAYKSLTKMIASQLDFSKAAQLAAVAQDLSITTGRSLSDEYEALLRSILQLQSRSLRLAGVYLTVDEVLNKLSATTGRNRNSFSTLEKQQALLNAVIEYGARVSGNFEAVLGTAAGQMKVFEKNVNDAEIALGNAFLPVMAETLKVLNAVLVLVAQHPHIVLTLGLAFVALAGSIVLARVVLTDWGSLFTTISKTTQLSLIGLTELTMGLTVAEEQQAIALTGVATASEAANIAIATTAATTLALGGVIAASTLIVFAAITALYVWATATNVAKGADEALVKQLLNKNDALQEDIKWLHDNTDAVNLNSDEHDRYTQILAALSPIEQQAIVNRNEYTHSTNDAADALQRLINVDDNKLKAQFVSLSSALTQLSPQISEYENKLNEIFTAREKAEKTGQSGFQITGEVTSVGPGGEVTRRQTAENIDTIEQLDAVTTALNDTNKESLDIWNKNISILADVVKHQQELDVAHARMTGDQDELSAAIGRTIQARLDEVNPDLAKLTNTKHINEALEREIKNRDILAGKTTPEKEAAKGFLDALTDEGTKAQKSNVGNTLPAISQDLTNYIEKYKTEVKGLEDFQKSNPQGVLKGISVPETVLASQSDAWSGLYEKIKKYFQEFGGQTAFDNFMKSQPEQVRQLLLEAEARKRGTFEIRDSLDARREEFEAVHRLDLALNKLRITVAALSGQTKDATASRRIEQIQLDQYVKLQEDIFKTRAELGKPIKAVGGTGITTEDLRKELEILNLEKKTKDEIFKLTLVTAEAQQKADIARLASVSDIAKAETLYQDKYFTYVLQRREAEENLTADIAVEIQKRAQFQRNVQQVEAQAYSDLLGEQRSARESVITALTRLNIQRGDFSVENANDLINKAKELTTNPLINSQKDLKTSTDKAKESTDNIGATLGTQGVKIDNNSSKLELNTAALGKLATTMANAPTYAPASSLVGGVFSQFKAGKLGSTPGTLSPSQIAADMAQVGFPAGIIPLMTAISQAESNGGNPRAYNPVDPDQSYGLLQINMKGDLGPQRRAKYGLSSNEDLFNPLTNLRIGLDLLKNGGGLINWGAYTNGSYRKYYNPSILGTPISQLSSSVIEPTAGDEYQQQAAAIKKAAQTGRGRQIIFDNLSSFGITPSGKNIDLYSSGGAESRGLAAVATNIYNLTEANKQRKVEQDLRQRRIQDFDVEHQKELELTRVEDLYTQSQKVRIDNVLQLHNAQEDLNRLYTDSISVLEQVQATQLKIVEADATTRKTTIELIERQKNIEHLATTAVQDELNNRFKADQDLYLRKKVLDATYTDEYLKSEQFRTRVTNEENIARRQDTIQLYTDIRKAEDNLTHFEDNAALRYKRAWLDALTAVKQAHEDAVIGELKDSAILANQTVIDTQKIRTSVLDDLAKVSTVNDSVAGLFKDTFKVYGDSIDVWIDKTTEKMGNLGKIFNGFFKDVFHRAEGTVEKSLLDLIFPASKDVTDAKKGIDTTVYLQEQNARQADTQSIETLVSANYVQIKAQTDLAINTQYTAAAIAQAGQALATVSQQVTGGQIGGTLSLLGAGGSFGGGTTRISGGLGGAISRGIGGLFGGGGFSAPALQNLLSGGSSTGVQLPSGNRAPLDLLSLLPGFTLPRLSTGGNVNTLSQGNILQRLLGLGGSGGIGAGLKGLGLSLGSQAPLLGLGLGASLGGTSKFGSILGGLSGGLAGLGVLGGLSAAFGIGAGPFAGLLSGIGTSGLGGAFAGLFGGGFGTLASVAAIAGPLALIAAPLAIGAILLARNSARRKAETERAQIIGDAITQLTTILSQVKSDKMDGTEAITQATQIRSDYITQVSAIKDSKTRGIALKDVSRLDVLISQIQAASNAQQRRKETDLGIVPTYAYGGVTSRDIIRVSQGESLIYPDMTTKSFGGRFDGKDNILTRAPRGTTVISPLMFGGYAAGGGVGTAPSILRPVMNITVVMVNTEQEAIDMVKRVPNAVLGKKVAADAKTNPGTLPAAIGDALGVNY
jgi:hypothetical protein